MNQTIFYNPEIEKIDRGDLIQLQIERLQSTLNRVYRNVSFYQKAFDSHHVNLEKLKDIRALCELPFTTKEDLQKSYPYEMFAVPLRDIVRIHSSTGTKGKPIVVGLTRSDMQSWTDCTARLLSWAGISEHDVVQIALDYSLFPGGFGLHNGAELIGSSVIPSSMTASVEMQIIIMKDFKTTVLVSTPGHASNIAAGLQEFKVHPESLHLKLGLFGGEQWSEQFRQHLEDKLHIMALDTYGLTEVIGLGMAGECPFRQGLHINEDHFIAEIINPKTLETVNAGEEGELVLTTITKEGFPLIRYRTGNLTLLNVQPCACGRTLARMTRIKKRIDDMIFFRGLGFFPSQFEEILLEVEGVSPHYQIILDRHAGVDTLEIKVEVSDQITGLDEVKTLETLRNQLVRRIKTVLDVDVKVAFVEPKSLQWIGTDNRVLDKRSDSNRS
jgi:phenylacetate-CoA ligase